MKKYLTAAYLTLLAASCFSQDFGTPEPKPKQDKPPFWDWRKVYVGGGLGLQFGTVTLVNISPDIGYRITERYSAGIGLRYIHMADNTFSPPFKLDIYGASVFNRFIVTKFLFLHAEYEVLNAPWHPYSTERYNLNNVWVGGGLRQVVGNSALIIMALYNLNDTPDNPIPNPQIRMGVAIGL